MEQDEDALVGSAAAVPKAMRKAVLAHRKAILGMGKQAPARRALESALDCLRSSPV